MHPRLDHLRRLGWLRCVLSAVTVVTMSAPRTASALLLQRVTGEMGKLQSRQIANQLGCRLRIRVSRAALHEFPPFGGTR